MTSLPYDYKPRAPDYSRPNRATRLDRLLTSELEARIASLRDSNPSAMLHEIKEADAWIDRAARDLHAARNERNQAIKGLSIDLADWNTAELRRAKLSRLDRTDEATYSPFKT